jgi:hypothetical protein
MVLNVLPMIGPRIIKAAITTMATKTRISAYSTKPWPLSLEANNMGSFLLSAETLYRVEICSIILLLLDSSSFANRSARSV